ncbi:hypothetical protein CVD25_18325 [Bacillus canaveralius]|uniref:Dehydrogenase n=1 Tax=Bacillus canaveralius TaxID=1403243 RepID=A0A2N5GSK1_9BACI|nr:MULTISPECIES: molecular chaperone TorD family protein [Bacillus]PLR84869.1 hypothetical protein CVD23_10825 [Bacillus sp. V33-4]PLR86751.1 hypothetical protein CU635_00180 [Bacillus canaveralius]PLR92787.1 hypothetical protein CVD25_18325 [Bacillus canaveralius]
MNTTINLPDLSNIFYARQYAYDILRRFFIEEPSRDYLKHFVQQNMIHLFPFLEESEDLKEGIDLVTNYLKEFDVVNNEDHFDNLHWDYTRMFIGPYEVPAPPWESVYVRKDRMIFQECTMDVRKSYNKFGFAASDDSIEADDHIGLELDFVYHLNELCIDSANKKSVHSINEVNYLLNEQQQFIKKHLSAFVPAFSQKVIDSADSQFYSGLARILNHYIKADSQVLHELLNIDFVN